MFEEDVYRRILHLFISSDINKRFLVVWYRIVDTFGRIYRSLHIFEYFFQFGFHFFRVDITDNDDSL